MLFYPNLPKVIGSDWLEAKLRTIHGRHGSPTACHVFGHTHFCWDATLDGVRYLSLPCAQAQPSSLDIVMANSVEVEFLSCDFS